MAQKKSINNEIFEIMLRNALIVKYENEAAAAMEMTNEYNFSEKFEKNIKRIRNTIGRNDIIRKAIKVFKNSLIAAASIMGVIFCGLLTQPEVYAAVGNVMRNIFSTHDRYTYQGNNEAVVFDDTKRFGYIPDEYELRSVFYMGNAMLLTYESDDGNNIYFNYSLAQGSSITVDNEGHTFNEINKNDNTYYFYNSTENGFNTLIWYDNNYAYSIDAQLDADVLVHIAENIT